MFENKIRVVVAGKEENLLWFTHKIERLAVKTIELPGIKAFLTPEEAHMAHISDAISCLKTALDIYFDGMIRRIFQVTLMLLLVLVNLVVEYLLLL